MGGNAKAIDRITGIIKTHQGKEAFANRLDLRTIDCNEFKENLVATLMKLNNEIHYLWPNPTPLVSGLMFSGSAANFFQVPTEEFLKHKTHLGDIDVMIPHQNLGTLFSTLALMEGCSVGSFVYVGQNRPTLHGSQISSIWFHKDYGFVQIDFEGVRFPNDQPDAFARFAHSSPWVDVKLGLKGVAHKYLLMVLAWVMVPVHNVVVLTDKSPIWPPDKVRRKTLHQPPRAMSFSVDKGLRWRLQIQKHNGVPVRLADGTAFKEIPTKDSKYITDPEQIFIKLFQLKPMDGDVERMGSFIGLIELCKLHLAPYQVREVFDQLCRYKLFGPGQALSRDAAADDREIKTRIIETLMKEFPFLQNSKTSVSDLMTEYYASYKERAIDE